MRPLATLLFLALALAPAWGYDKAPERTLTLDDSVRLALLNDARFLQAEQDIRIAEQRTKEARFLFYPEIGFGVNASAFEADRPFVLQPQFSSMLIQPDPEGRLYSGRAYLQQTIYSGGRTMNTLRLTKAGLKQAKARYEAARLDVRLNTHKVFYEYLLAVEKRRILKGRIEESQAALAKEGLGAWEKLEAETLLDGLRAAQAEALHQEGRARLEYLKSLNLELDTSVALEGRIETRPVHAEIEKLAVWAIELRPELQSEVYQAQMDAIALNLSLARRLPSVVVGLDYEYVGNDFPLRQKNWDATIGLRLPISYDFFSQLQQRRAEQRQGQIKRAELQDQVKLDVREAWQSLQFWQGEWERRREAWEDAQRLYAAAAKVPGPALTRVRALKALADSETRALQSIVEHLLAKASLERAVGRPLEQ